MSDKTADRATYVRSELSRFNNVRKGMGAIVFALANVLEIPESPRKLGFKKQTGDNTAAIRDVCRSLGGDASYVASNPSDDGDDEGRRSRIGKTVYSERHSGDPVRFFLMVAGIEDSPAARSRVERLRFELDPGRDVDVPAALSILGDGMPR